jgi:plastocyanin
VNYGSYINSTSGSNQSLIEYSDSILGQVQIHFETPIDYSCQANGRGTYHGFFEEFSEIVENGEPHTIGISSNAYEPGVRTVTPGTKVEWTNQESSVHTVTSDTGLWDSGNLSKGQSFSYTFTELGTYPYHDTLHPSVTGVVNVVS